MGMMQIWEENSSHGYREAKYPYIYITTSFGETKRTFPEIMFVFKVQVIPLFASFTTIFRETLIFGEVEGLLTLKIYTCGLMSITILRSPFHMKMTNLL